MEATSATTSGVHFGTFSLAVVKTLRLEVTLCASSESSFVISFPSGSFERSIPVQPLTSTRPPIVDAYFLTSASFSWASSSVRPMIGVKVQKNLIEAGSRPSSLARRRMFAILGARTEGAWPVTKIASACFEANADPALGKSSVH